VQRKELELNLVEPNVGTKSGCIWWNLKLKLKPKNHEKTIVVIGFCRKVPKHVMVVNGLIRFALFACLFVEGPVAKKIRPLTTIWS
jgi:hypothetical protein